MPEPVYDENFERLRQMGLKELRSLERMAEQQKGNNRAYLDRISAMIRRKEEWGGAEQGVGREGREGSRGGLLKWFTGEG